MQMKDDSLQMLGEKQDSIEITRGTRGDYGWKMKLYYDHDKGGAESALSSLHAIDERLQKDYLEEATGSVKT